MTIEEAIARIKDHKIVHKMNEPRAILISEALDMAIEALKQTRWIPVSERLPEDYKTVIASTEYGVYPEARHSKEYGWEWAYESGADYWEELAEVKAWMPLPEPYKAELRGEE